MSNIEHEFLVGDFTAPGSFRGLAGLTPARVLDAVAGQPTNATDCYPTSPNSPGRCRTDEPCQV